MAARFVSYDDRLGPLTDDGGGVRDLTDRLGIDADDPLREYIAGDHDVAEDEDGDPTTTWRTSPSNRRSSARAR